MSLENGTAQGSDSHTHIATSVNSNEKHEHAISSQGQDSSPPSAKQEEQKEEEEFQEGGFRGWATVIGAICIQTCGFGYTNTFGVYQDYYTRIYITNSSSSTISWIGSVNAFLVIGGGLFAGVLFDRGYFYHLLYGGSFLISFSLFMLSLTQPNHLYQNFLTQGLLHGLGTGLMFIPSMAVVTHYFRRRRAFAMTLVAAGSSIGALIHPIMLNNLFYTRLGFAGSVRVSAGLVTVLLIIACCLMRPRLPPPAVRPNMLKSVRRFYKEPAYAMASIGLLFFTVGFYFPLFYLQLDAEKHGINSQLAFYSLVILNAAGLFGRISAGFLANSLGVINMIVVACFGCTALIFAMIGLGNIASVIIIAILYGLTTGMFVALQAPLIAVLTVDMSELGMRLGVSFAFCAIGALIGPPINGALLTENFIWWRPAVVSGVFAFVGASFFAVINFLLRKPKPSEEVQPTA